MSEFDEFNGVEESHVESPLKTYSVNDAFGKTHVIKATRVDLNSELNSVTFYDGDDVVGVYRGFNSFGPHVEDSV